ncbi:hypothetical protein [Kocuria sp.]|uniref:hypothetical protein n=1 Tax=Kocuria sp. TaxID=1871328 RepID=UPI0026DFB214|nr:hypothetical protein [Kocuria sp.]MDO5617857.1 hypothetical protein [Kocuria sp.]
MPILTGLIPIPEWLGRFGLSVMIVGLIIWMVRWLQTRGGRSQEVRNTFGDEIHGDWGRPEWSGVIPGVNAATFRAAADVFAHSPQFVVHGLNPHTGLLMLRGQLTATSYGYVTTVRYTPGVENPEVTVTSVPYSSIGPLAGAEARRNVAQVVETLRAVAAPTSEPVASPAGQ